MTPFFCYYGGKWRIARHYPKPRFPLVIEPFAGAAGYSTFWEPESVFLVDADPILARLWTYLLGATREDILALPMIDAGQDVRTLPVSEGAQDLIAFWLNKGCSRPRRTAAAWMRSGIRPGSFWGEKIRARVADQIGAVSNWRACFGSFENIPDVEATWFIDPPYAGRAGSHYSHGSSKIDYAHLADWCRSRRGQVIVCEAQGADWLPFKPLGTFKANATSIGRRTAEGIWTND